MARNPNVYEALFESPNLFCIPEALAVSETSMDLKRIREESIQSASHPCRGSPSTRGWLEPDYWPGAFH